MLLLRILVLALPIYATVLPTPQPHLASADSRQAVLTEEQSKDFRSLIDALPEQCIHTALQNELVHYKDGVFQYSRAALEKIHSQDPALATKLVSAAALEAFKVSLSKRQNPNTTVPVVPTTPPVSSEVGPGQTSVPNAPNSPTTGVPIVSINIPITTTDQRGNTITTQTPASGIVITSTNRAGSTLLLTSAVTPNIRPITTTDSRGSTFVTGVTPGGGGQGSSLVIQTTTLPDGRVSTITSYEIVGATGAGATTATNPSGATASGPAPSLQTGAASLLSWRLELEAAALLSLAAGFAWYL